MKNYIYYTKKSKFETENYFSIPWSTLHSPDEETPALIYPNGIKEWWFEGKRHRLSGPAGILGAFKLFYLNGLKYSFEDWLKLHPNIDIYLETKGMNETQKALWKLKNL